MHQKSRKPFRMEVEEVLGNDEPANVRRPCEHSRWVRCGQADAAGVRSVCRSGGRKRGEDRQRREWRPDGDTGAEQATRGAQASNGGGVVCGEGECVGRGFARGVGLGVRAAAGPGAGQLRPSAIRGQLLRPGHCVCSCELGFQRLLPVPQRHGLLLQLPGHCDASHRRPQYIDLYLSRNTEGNKRNNHEQRNSCSSSAWAVQSQRRHRRVRAAILERFCRGYAHDVPPHMTSKRRSICCLIWCSYHGCFLTILPELVPRIGGTCK